MKTVSTQPFKQGGGKGAGDDDAAEQGQVTAPQTNTNEVDSMLDEIDGVLESNAAEFVQGFVQKGGQ